MTRPRPEPAGPYDPAAGGRGAWKHELARFCLDRFRQHGFVGRGATLRVVGPDLQWVVQVVTIGHVDQVDVALGIVFAPAPPATRVQCRVLWSLAGLVGSDDVARALVPASALPLDERRAVIGEAIDVAAAVVHAHPDRAQVAAAYRRGRLERAFVLPDARDLLGSA